MKRIPKELADKMVMEILVTIGKNVDVSDVFAKNSMDIMQNETDNSVLTGILLSKAKPCLFDDNEIDMKLTILSALQTVFTYTIEENDTQFNFNKDLAKNIRILYDLWVEFTKSDSKYLWVFQDKDKLKLEKQASIIEDKKQE